MSVKMHEVVAPFLVDETDQQEQKQFYVFSRGPASGDRVILVKPLNFRLPEEACDPIVVDGDAEALLVLMAFEATWPSWWDPQYNRWMYGRDYVKAAYLESVA